MRVRAVRELRDHFALTAGREYRAVGMTAASFRVIDDDSQPVLYPKECFDLIDPEVPADWKWKIFSEEEYYADPPELAGERFWERYFTGDREAIATFTSYTNK